MKTVHVATGKPYDIFIERGMIGSCADYVKKLTSARRVTVISDSNVAPLYLEKVTDPLKSAGFGVNAFVFEAGEKQKHLGTISDIYRSLADFGMTRKDIQDQCLGASSIQTSKEIRNFFPCHNVLL